MNLTKHNGNILASVDGTDVVDCVVCGFAHVLPLPTPETLKKFYEVEFYQEERKDYFKEVEEDRDWWMLAYEHYYDLLESHTTGRRLLDVGSGPGYFMEAGKRRGWEVIGIEPSRMAARYSRERGLQIIEESFPAKSVASSGLFDVVAFNFVLEHISDAASFVKAARKLLKPGGLLFVDSPNDFNPLQNLYTLKHGVKPWWVVPTHHVNYFTIRSLPIFIANEGFSVVHRETTYPVEFFLLSGRNYINNPPIGRATHRERKSLETALYKNGGGILEKMFLDWAEQGIGREVIAIGKKHD